jgi:DNA-binding NtrC family response regulator
MEKPIFITQSSLMRDLQEKIKLVAKTKATLLITGENGTGKEVLSKLYHYYSNRRQKPMVSVNCGAIPSELVESELFGHEKGAFTGAHSRKEGCFEQADGGMLFLDEIGEMSFDNQVKLLRAIELGSFRRVGGKEEIKVDINLVSATNKVLMDQVKAGSFREDLYYRINVIELYIPPLRHRKEDIPLLIDFYKSYYADLYETQEITFSEECMQTLTAYDWPGNVRELRNMVERIVVLSQGQEVNPALLPASITKTKPFLSSAYSGDSPEDIIQIPIGMSLKEVEQRVIQRTLESVENNKTEAAKILGFARKTLHNKLDQYEQQIV